APRARIRRGRGEDRCCAAPRAVPRLQARRNPPQAGLYFPPTHAPLSSASLGDIQALINARRYADARQACEAILSREPRHAGARYFRALTLFQEMRFEEARPDVEALVRDEPKMLAAKYLLG